jgi:hypothetical protein
MSFHWLNNGEYKQYSRLNKRNKLRYLTSATLIFAIFFTKSKQIYTESLCVYVRVCVRVFHRIKYKTIFQVFYMVMKSDILLWGKNTNYKCVKTSEFWKIFRARSDA